MTREEIKDFCYMKVQLEPENEDIFMAIVKILEQEPCCNCIEFKKYAKEMGFEIEQYPKSEWQKDHEILKAYSDGYEKGIEVIDKLRAEIDNALSDGMIHKKTVLGIIDKYKAESKDKE